MIFETIVLTIRHNFFDEICDNFEGVTPLDDFFLAANNKNTNYQHGRYKQKVVVAASKNAEIKHKKGT